MPKVSRFFVKAALLCLVLGGAVAGLALSGAGGLPPVLLALRPLAWHLLTVGWATQLIFGVAFWMFPHVGGEHPRGDERLAWVSFWTLNGGLALRAIGEPLAALRPTPVAGVLLPLAATLQLAGVLIFVLLAWPRVRGQCASLGVWGQEAVMPVLARWYLRTSLLYLALGTLLGAVILWGKGAPIVGAWTLLAPHIALVTWGWLLLLTLGVAYWILPRWGQERRRVWLAVSAYVCLNAALWLVGLAPWLNAPWTNAAGGALQALGCLAFALHAWPRVRKSAFGR